jgi:3-deoxy-manno-octulosonate cytidylyltransferase (CMP-KDO synthetase)
MAKGSGLIVIPARRASTRLPDKLLLSDTGKPVLQHTIERALEAAALLAGVRVWVACDDPTLADVARACGVGVVLVTEPCDSGTQRIARALPALPTADVIVNLQADEPEMPAAWIVQCLEACQVPDGPELATIAVPTAATDPALNNPNVVKVVLDHAGLALYFSRATIPYVRQGGTAPEPRALRHMGIYAYTRRFLAGYHELPPSPLEQSECLEQLRFLQAGNRIWVLVQERLSEMGGIDTAEDYRAFCRRQMA